MMLTGCMWPRIVYQPTYWTFDNRIIDIDDGHSYDVIETETGYDLIFHFIAE